MEAVVVNVFAMPFADGRQNYYMAVREISRGAWNAKGVRCIRSATRLSRWK